MDLSRITTDFKSEESEINLVINPADQLKRGWGVNPETAAFLISAIFILPFVLCSATSGQIADKYDKAMLTRFVKTFEIGVMLVGGAGFWLHSAPLLYLCTFLMGVHSTLFGPVKYAYLPQHLDADEIFSITKLGFDFFHQTFDYRYPWPKYDQLFVPEFNAGAMENSGCVTFLEDYVFRSKVTDVSY